MTLKAAFQAGHRCVRLPEWRRGVCLMLGDTRGAMNSYVLLFDPPANKKLGRADDHMETQMAFVFGSEDRFVPTGPPSFLEKAVAEGKLSNA